MGLWLVLGLTLSALAVPPPPAAPPTTQQPETPKDLVAKLRQGSRGERKYAARELRRVVRDAVQAERHADPDSIRGLEARQTLAELQDPLGLACVASLSDPAIARNCAEILGMLEFESAIAPLRAALEVDPRWRTRRAMERALTDLETTP